MLIRHILRGHDERLVSLENSLRQVKYSDGVLGVAVDDRVAELEAKAATTDSVRTLDTRITQLESAVDTATAATVRQVVPARPPTHPSAFSFTSMYARMDGIFRWTQQRGSMSGSAHR